ncbi:MAG: DUF559 domain-containing protein [Ignavibacteriae bacterium]|nr:MAG: DUF559 domain-containing protein [Ignavibacteriota bacterium]
MVMVKIFNRKTEQKRRRHLHRNMPKSEVLIWMKMKNRQMNGERFLRQYGIGQYILDFYCSALIFANKKQPPISEDCLRLFW